MRAIAPRTGAPERTFAEEQEEYSPITVAAYAYSDGAAGLLMRFTFTDEERRRIAEGEDVYFMQLYPGCAPPSGRRIVMTPVSARVGPGDWVWAPEDHAPYDFAEAWRCPGCRAWNHESRATCAECATERPAP